MTLREALHALLRRLAEGALKAQDAGDDDLADRLARRRDAVSRFVAWRHDAERQMIAQVKRDAEREAGWTGRDHY
jgi:hypothetical protein